MVNIKKNLLVLLTLTICFAGKANAGFLIEPHAGFALAGTIEQNTTTGSYSGLNFGARAGYSMLGLMGGATYNMSMSTDYEFTQGLTKITNKAKRTDLGLFVGYELPILLRVWGSYYLDTKVEGEDAPGTPLVDSTGTWKGTGYGVGVGFTGLPFVSLNVEYKMFTFTDKEDSDATPIASTFTPNITVNEVLLTVSLPLSF